MPYIIIKKNGKPYNWDRNRPLLRGEDVADYQRDGKRVGDCWTFQSPVTMRKVKVGACSRETPPDLWGARRGLRDAGPAAAPSASMTPAQKPAAPTVAGWWPFGKKKPKRNPMSRRIYMIKTKSGTYVPAGVASMQGARRRRKRRRR